MPANLPPQYFEAERRYRDIHAGETEDGRSRAGGTTGITSRRLIWIPSRTGRILSVPGFLCMAFNDSLPHWSESCPPS